MVYHFLLVVTLKGNLNIVVDTNLSFNIGSVLKTLLLMIKYII